MRRVKMMRALTILSILSIFVYAQAAPVPDTGQTQSYTDTFGEDSDYIINPHSYTKMDAQGNILPDSSLSWCMVKDNVTGLIWEVKTDDGSIHDKNNIYNWDDAQDVFIADLNAANFGNSSEWRLPTVKELSFLVNSGRYDPAIDTTVFPNTISSHYWSSTIYANNTDRAWCVYFGNGYVFFNNKLGVYHVRAVHGGRPAPSDNLIIGDLMVTDPSTGLMWQRDAAGVMTWEQAINYCESLSLGGYTDWRLPNRNELHSLTDYTRCYPAIDTAAFPNAMSYTYWSSTTKAEDTRVAWNMDFFYGVFGYSYYYAMYVKAVRGGQSVHMVILNVLVYAAGTCNAIDGAQVRIGNTVEETDQAGLATFHDVHLGEHEIAIEALGYALYQTTIDLSELGKTVSVGYYLQPLCEGDFDADGDVDGSDLAVFAAGFGRTNCDKPDVLPCKGDFDIDGDVDGSDLAIFAADFGRTNCPACPSE